MNPLSWSQHVPYTCPTVHPLARSKQDKEPLRRPTQPRILQHAVHRTKNCWKHYFLGSTFVISVSMATTVFNPPWLSSILLCLKVEVNQVHMQFLSFSPIREEIPSEAPSLRKPKICMQKICELELKHYASHPEV